MLRCVAAALLVATLQTATAASAEQSAGSDQRAFADITVDGVDAGKRTIAIANDGDVLVSVEDAHALQIPALATARRSVRGHEYVSLRRLSPDVSFEFDEAKVALAIHVTARLLATHTLLVDQRLSPAPLDASRPTSAFGNYFLEPERTRHFRAFATRRRRRVLLREPRAGRL